MTITLKRIRVRGFRSLRDVEVGGLRSVTVLIGPNGSGKSNLLAALELVRKLADGFLQLHVGQSGGASFLLHRGPRPVQEIHLELDLAGDGDDCSYEARLAPAPGEALYFVEEKVGFRPQGSGTWQMTSLGAGHRESRLRDVGDHDATVRKIRELLQDIQLFHFHDTSATSALRSNARQGDDQGLHGSGRNLPAFLLALKRSGDPMKKPSVRRIESAMGQIAPFVRELVPTEIDGGAVRLDWLDEGGERFNAAHFSDGTLRALALFTALGQPTAMVPRVCMIDEPELGLHPAALDLFCAMVRSVSAHRQVILATQSPATLDQFDVADVIVTERLEGATQVRRLDPEALAIWLEEYGLSELYDKNVLGGRP